MKRTDASPRLLEVLSGGNPCYKTHAAQHASQGLPCTEASHGNGTHACSQQDRQGLRWLSRPAEASVTISVHGISFETPGPVTKLFEFYAEASRRLCTGGNTNW